MLVNKEEKIVENQFQNAQEECYGHLFVSFLSRSVTLYLLLSEIH